MGLVLLLILSLVVAAPLAESQVDEWHESSYGVGAEKVTRLHLYLHDMVSGKNPSVVKIADHPNTNSPGFFGFLAMADDPLTEGPEPTSKTLGRAQGLIAFASREEFTDVMSVNFVFTEGDFKGSSLSILGGNQILQPVREMPIIGGTGVFRFARGFVVAKTYWANVTTHDLIEEYHLTVMHY
ncbi:Plant disease resistance response protein [Macleaya cordata]|uniref:Dirigent protein n=1 Tax=Macleaya cordata TaxID=56857 RepID=A0A200Q745_MACCD|nr:Plant disease resistance response protein [Macleaya cordata]